MMGDVDELKPPPDDPIKLERREIEISGGRTMTFFNFELDGAPMQEMQPQDVVATFSREQPQKADG